MKDCFAILTYCDTPKKIDDLLKCIEQLKRFDIDILIHAHYPLDLDIQKMVKYYIYDSSNPVINDGSKGIIRWRYYGIASKLLTIITPDYCYAVMNQWIYSLNFLKDKGYEKIHIINYDIQITDYLLNKHENGLDQHNMVFESSGIARDFNAGITEKKIVSVAFFSIRSSFISTFIKDLTLEKYLSSVDTMLEGYTQEIIDKYDNIQILPHSEDITNVSTEITKGFEPLKITYHNLAGEEGTCTVFCGMNKDVNKFEIFIFDISMKIDNFTVNINRELTNISNITDTFYSIMTKYSGNEINKFVDDNRILMYINDENIDKDIIKAIKIQTIQSKTDTEFYGK